MGYCTYITRADIGITTACGHLCKDALAGVKETVDGIRFTGMFELPG